MRLSYSGWAFRLICAFALILFVCRLGFSQGAAKIYGITVSNEPQSARLTNDSQVDPADSAGKVADVMKAGDKMKFGLKRAFLNPGTYIFPAINSVRQQMDADEPNKDNGDQVADGLTRYAINYGRAGTKALLVFGVYPIIFKQNPHYERSPNRGFGARVLHAASRVFVTRGDNGNHQINSSQLAGNLTASALANIWEQNSPGHDRIGVGPTFRRFGNMLVFDVISFTLLKEFGPDIKKRLTGK